MIKKDLLFILTTFLTLVLIVFLAHSAMYDDAEKLPYKSAMAPKLAMSRYNCETAGGDWASIKMNGIPNREEWLFKCRCPATAQDVGSIWVSEGELRTCR